MKICTNAVAYAAKQHTRNSTIQNENCIRKVDHLADQIWTSASVCAASSRTCTSRQTGWTHTLHVAGRAASSARVFCVRLEEACPPALSGERSRSLRYSVRLCKVHVRTTAGGRPVRKRGRNKVDAPNCAAYTTPAQAKSRPTAQPGALPLSATQPAERSLLRKTSLCVPAKP